MAYTQRYAGGFANGDNAKQVDATFLNNVETALLALFGVTPATNGALIWDGTKFTAAALVKNAQIDAAAAIDKTKLAALNIADADVSGSAAIAASKLAAIPPSKLTGYPSDVTQVLKGDASWAKPSGYELFYTEFQSGVAITATTEGTAQDVVSSGAQTYDGTAVMVEFYAPIMNPDNAAVGRQITLILKDGSTVLGSFQTVVNLVAGVTIYEQSSLRKKITPSAGSHTFKVAAFVSAGTGAVSGGPGGSAQYIPIFIRITKS